jgi:AraC-like DNA-binding protein
MLLDDARIFTRSLAAGASVPWHDHGRPTLCIVRAGAVHEEDARGDRVRKAGDVVFRPEPERHRNFADAATTLMVIEFPQRSLEQLDRLGMDVEATTFTSTSRTLFLARQLSLKWSHRIPWRGLEMMSMVYDLLAEVARSATVEFTPRGWLQAVRARLDRDFRENLTLAELARGASVAPSTISKLFRQETGTTVHDYLASQRLQEATRLLARDEMSIAEIATEVGFCDQSHLNRVMRRRLGLTPAAFRRQATVVRHLDRPPALSEAQRDAIARRRQRSR